MSSDQRPFFERFDRFVETSGTGHDVHRLNARYEVLINANAGLLRDARVLDLASHDGRFSFAALQNGARHVVGIEHDDLIVEKCLTNFASYGVPQDDYEFVVGDVFEYLRSAERVDVVFCFGLLYHIHDHMMLLTLIAELQPRALIVDTNITMREAAVIELRNPVRGHPPVLGSELEGYPSRAALDAMLASFGWTYEYFDWPNAALAEDSSMQDYRAGRRVTAVVDCCRSALDDDAQARAVEAVLARRRTLDTQWLTIKYVASEHGMSPQFLRTLVRRAERDAGWHRASLP
jgi:hypothetical protein